MASVKQVNEYVTNIISDATRYMDRITILSASSELDTSRNLMNAYFNQDVYDPGELACYKDTVSKNYIKLEFLLSEFLSQYKESYKMRSDIKKVYNKMFEIVKSNDFSHEIKVKACSFMRAIEVAHASLCEIKLDIDEDKFNEVKTFLSKEAGYNV